MVEMEKNFLVLYKNKGKFYNAYKVDSYILKEIFGYKVIDGKKAEFPDNVFNKVENKINDLKISYQIIGRKEYINSKYKEYIYY